MTFGVPQGSCAGPVIFTMYIAARKNTGQKYDLGLYGYADDHKIAFRIQVGDAQSETIVIKQLSVCLTGHYSLDESEKVEKLKSFCMEISRSLRKLTSRV